MKAEFNSACSCFIGFGRENNEDNFCFNRKHMPELNNGIAMPLEYSSSTENNQLFAVFDGLGGEAYGEKAAFIASELFLDEYDKLDKLVVPGTELLENMCNNAHKAIISELNTDNACSAGSTVAALYLLGEEAVICNVGDSRVYRIRDNEMTLVSKDHTDSRILEAMGINKTPVLLQYLGNGDIGKKTEPFISRGKLKSGDIFILCTDGVSDVLGAENIMQAVTGRDVGVAVTEIIGMVKKAMGADNATVMVIKIK